MFRKGLDSIQLKYLAMAFMLCDHIWATVVSGNEWLTYIGRLAFPIFAFQLVEGYFNTHDYNKYWKRLLIFALISEIPFNFMMVQGPIFPFHQNVMFTLLYGLVAIHFIELMREEFKIKYFAVVMLMTLLSAITFVDFGLLGFLTIMLFYISRELPYAKIIQFIGMLYLHCISFEGQMLVFNVFGHNLEIAVQSFAILSLIFIWMYNGEKGSDNKYVRTFGYWFYPAHMLILSTIGLLIK